jgi:hypothetical protein
LICDNRQAEQEELRERASGEKIFEESAGAEGNWRIECGSLGQLCRNLRSVLPNHLARQDRRSRFAVGPDLLRLSAIERGRTGQRKALDEWVWMHMEAQPRSVDHERLHINKLATLAPEFFCIAERDTNALTPNMDRRCSAVGLGGFCLLAVSFESGASKCSKSLNIARC